jgi:hypothetical protein
LFDLVQALIPLSERKNQGCLLEWELYHVDVLERYGEAQCACSHDIKRRFFIRNKINHNETVVGSCCINRIGGDNDASHLKLRFRSKMEYLESALIMCKNDNERAVVEAILSKWNEWGSRLLITEPQRGTLNEITGKNWKKEWTWDAQYEKCPQCGSMKHRKYLLCRACEKMRVLKQEAAW